MPQCLKEEASGEELCPPLAAALSWWMFGTAPTLAFSPLTFFVIPSFFPQPLHTDESSCQSILEAVQQPGLSGSPFL